MVSTISACSLGVFSVRDIKKRSQFFFVTPGVVFVTYVAVIAGFGLARFTGWEQFLNDLFFIAVNSIFIQIGRASCRERVSVLLYDRYMEWKIMTEWTWQ